MVSFYEREAQKMIDALNSPILTVQDKFSNEVLRIDQKGNLFWHNREVETDEDFRAAMIEMRDLVMEWGKPSYPTIFGFNINRV